MKREKKDKQVTDAWLLERGKRLAALRAHFELQPEEVSELSGGRVAASTIRKAESGHVKWKGTQTAEGLAAAFGLSYEKMKAYLDGELDRTQAIKLASPYVVTWQQRSVDREQRDDRFRRILEKAREEGPLLDAMEAIARERLRGHTLSGPLMPFVSQIRLWNDAVSKALDEVDRNSSTRLRPRPQ